MTISLYFLCNINSILYNLTVPSKDKRKIYSVLFRENFYIINWRYAISIRYCLVQSNKMCFQISFVIIKKLIKQIRLCRKDEYQYDKNFFQLNLSIYNNKYISFLQLLCFALVSMVKPSHVIYICSRTLNANMHNNMPQVESSISNKTAYYANDIAKNTLSSSIHTPLLFLENRWFSCSSLVKANITSWTHPEIIFRILRQHIQDTNVLHMVRQTLYYLGNNVYNSLQIFCKDTNQIQCVLSNLYAFELDKFVVYELSKMKDMTQTSNFFCVYKISVYKKKHKYELFTLFTKKCNIQMKRYDQYQNIQQHNVLITISWYAFLGYYYSRYNNLCIIGNQHTEKHFVLLFYARFNRFYRRRLGRFVRYIHIQFVQFRLQYLASCFEICKKRVNLKFEQQNTLQKMGLIIPNVHMSISKNLLIRVLYLTQFCTYKGYPLSRSNWTSLHDGQIIERFQQILSIILYYFIGFTNYSVLCHIYYILQYSCAKTLAEKHKTTLTLVYKIYAQQLWGDHLYAKIKNIYMIFLFNNKRSFDYTRIWHFELLELDFIIYIIQK